jgi:biopolymer transport protein ExbB/TolQ
MALTPSQRPTREWPLFVLALAMVGIVCLPLSQSLLGNNLSFGTWVNWDAERWGRLLFGPEQIACYCCFTWAALIVLNHYLEIRRQRRAFALPLLPTEEGARILHEDARPLLRKVEQVTASRGPLILPNMIRLALGKFASTRSGKDLSETVRTQAEVDQGRLVTSMATVHYLAWAIPALGFLGTVRGLAGGFTMATRVDEEDFLRQATQHLNVAFDCTLMALALSLAVMFLVHSVQRDEEQLVIDCQQYCLEHLVNRVYEPESTTGGAGAAAGLTGRDRGAAPAAGRTERVSR